MYRILIADDEALERQGLELMISRAMPGKFVFFHAENGRVAIEKSEQEKPDIIFMDIKMPGIQGIDALKEIAQILPHAKTVLVTAYDHFGYAKEALSLGVSDYLLKPKKKQEVLDVVNKLIEKMELEKKLRNKELTQRETISQLQPLVESEICLMIMMKLVIEPDFNELNELLKTRIETGYALVISLQLSKKDEHELEKQTIYAGIKSFIKLSEIDCLVSPLIGNRITLFNTILNEDSVKQSLREESITFAKKIYKFIDESYGIKAIIGIGTKRKGLEGLRYSYYEATTVVSSPYHEQSIYHYSQYNKGKQKEYHLNIETELLAEINKFNLHQAIIVFDQAFDLLVESTDGDFNQCRNEVMALFISLNKHFLRQGVKVADIGNISDTTQLEQLKHVAEIWLHLLIEAVQKEKENRTESLIDQAKRFINENYHKEITMEYVSELINLSPFYFSKIFKKYEGITFIDYLTNVRIEKSKELLLDHHLSFKEICFLVGYNDPNYFSRVFKKVTEFSPTEYRQNLLNSNLLD
ncbi:response regulator transcription factor [Metabacillus litoralis]|uniref:response regulator transcription factor n=1 Tax=Metabacillus litoralis TaxID=152268 RepID=UPI002041DE48|nr:response regulator [Metabacillus litoralis]MCM3411294.1 response regulator [Metabacillus litoralis]